MKVLKDDLHLDTLTVTGKAFREVIENATVYDEEIIPPRDNPHLTVGGTAILYGNVAPEGAVIKQSAVAADMMVFSGKAPNQPIMQILEIPSHPFFIGTQAHPCLTSRPLKPQPMFVGLVAAAMQKHYPTENLREPVKAVRKVCNHTA